MAYYSIDQMYQMALNAGFTGNSAATITAIAQAESGGNPAAINYNDPNGGSFGLTQINGVHPGAQNALDPQTAFDLAYQVSNGGTNFSPWSTYSSGAYQQYLPQATLASGQSWVAPLDNNFGIDPNNVSTNASPFTGYDNPLYYTGDQQTLGDVAGGYYTGSSAGVPISNLPNSISDPGALSDIQLQQLQAGGPSNVGSNLFAPFQGTGSSSPGTSFFTTIENFMSRFGIILVGIVLVGVAAWGAMHGEFGQKAQKVFGAA